MITQTENINELVTALSKCQGEMKPAIKDSLNPHFKSKFATLNSIWEACREPLSKNGLAVIQTMDSSPEGQIIIFTTLAHASGQWIRSRLPVITQRNDAQGIGSSLTYMKRYALSAIVGISTDDDDDAEKAMGRDEPKTKQKQSILPVPAKANAPVTAPNMPISPSNEPLKMINKEQWEELDHLIEQCDRKYQMNLKDYLANEKVSSFEQMDEKMFLKLRKGCLGNIEFNKKKDNEDN